jgi:DNA polymerase-3 subunit delta
VSPPKVPTIPVHLLWGESAFLLRDAAFQILGEVRPREVDAADWRGGETSDLATPSLFGERRALLVSDAKALPDEALFELKQYLQAADPDAPLILLATVGQRAKAPAALVKLVEPVGAVTQVKLQRKDLTGWMLQRARGKGLDLSPEGASAILGTLGPEPGVLEQALDQLGAAYPGERMTAEVVARQFRGLGEQHVWDLCDKAFSLDLPAAMRSLRTLLEEREAGLMILGGITSRLRDLLRVKSLPDRLPPTELAERAGLRFDWQARRYAEQARRFSMDDLVSLHERVTWADRALKSGATDDVVLPLLISAIAGEPARV